MSQTAVREPTDYSDAANFIVDLADRHCSISDAQKELNAFQENRVYTRKPKPAKYGENMGKWTTIHTDLQDACDASATSTQVDDLFDIGGITAAECEAEISQRKDEKVLKTRSQTREAEATDARVRAAPVSWEPPEKFVPPVIGEGIVAGLFGACADEVKPLPEATFAILKAAKASKTNMSEHTENRAYEFSLPAVDRVAQHRPPIALEVLPPEVQNLCASLREFILKTVEQGIHSGRGLSERELQNVVLPATKVLACALGIDIDMRDGRGKPKVVIFDGKTTLVGLLDIYGIMQYTCDIDVCAIDFELKVPEVLGGRQLLQLFDQLLALTARHTPGRCLDLVGVTSSGVRCVLGLLGNGITGVAATWLGAVEDTFSADGIPKQKFFLESANEHTGIFGLLAEKMIKSVRLRARCLTQNDISDTSAAGRRYAGGDGADGPSDRTLPPFTPLPRNMEGGGQSGAGFGPPPVYEGDVPAGDTAACVISKKSKGLNDISNQVKPVQRSETVLRLPTPPRIIEYDPFKRFTAEGPVPT
jgi:hypothetical protein